MQPTKTTKIIGSIVGVTLLAITSATVFRSGTYTDTDLENYIQTSILAGTVPQFDISKVSPDRISKAYLNVAKKLGDDPGADLRKNTAVELNLYNRIRNKAKENGLTVKASVESWSETERPVN